MGVEGVYSVRLGDVGLPSPDGFSRRTSEPFSTRTIRIADDTGVTVYEAMTQDAPQAADRHIAKAGFRRTAPWRNGACNVAELSGWRKFFATRLRMANADERAPMRLPYVFLFGFLSSLLVVGGTIWLFAAYETADWLPMSHSPRLSQDKWFEIVRNAVTSAAALGVGVTLFFSFRRQQTAERNQRIGQLAQLTAAEAQKTAAEALDLSNRQHSLDQDRRRDSVTTELRARYAKTSEQLGSDQLSVRLAGVYSLAGLADDWAENGNEDERQVCIDLLCAYFRSEQPGESTAVRRELAEATLQVVTERLQADAPTRKNWGKARVLLVDPGKMPRLNGIGLTESGSVTIQGASLNRPAFLQDLTLDGGRLQLIEIQPGGFRLVLGKTRLLAAGALDVAFRRRRPGDGPGTDAPSRVLFRQLDLDGGRLRVNGVGCHVVFDRCEFYGGRINVRVLGNETSGPGSVTFTNCVFHANPFAQLSRSGLASSVLSTESLIVYPNCTFDEGVQVLESSQAPGAGAQEQDADPED